MISSKLINNSKMVFRKTINFEDKNKNLNNIYSNTMGVNIQFLAKASEQRRQVKPSLEYIMSPKDKRLLLSSIPKTTVS